MASPANFAAVLDSEPVIGQLPIGLPLAHLSTARDLASVLRDGIITPHSCKVFQKDLIYFSYGGVFYRNHNLQTENAAELPVAFVFSPRALACINRVFPFDTGAMSNHAFGPDWYARLEPFDQFGVATNDAMQSAQKIVHHVYGSNKAYIFGDPSKGCRAKAQPLPLLYEFLSADLSHISVDHRQRSIECLSDIRMNLGKYLLWIGVPTFPAKRRNIEIRQQIFKWTQPEVPLVWEYQPHKNLNPLAYGQMLELKAREQLIDRYLEMDT